MLTIREAKQIAYRTFEKKIGKKNFQKQKRKGCFGYSKDDNDIFHCFFGYHTVPAPFRLSKLTLEDCEQFPNRVLCNVSLRDGTVSNVMAIFD